MPGAARVGAVSVGAKLAAQQQVPPAVRFPPLQTTTAIWKVQKNEAMEHATDYAQGEQTAACDHTQRDDAGPTDPQSGLEMGA